MWCVIYIVYLKLEGGIEQAQLSVYSCSCSSICGSGKDPSLAVEDESSGLMRLRDIVWSSN